MIAELIERDRLNEDSTFDEFSDVLKVILR